MKNERLVFSTNPDDNRKCPRCGELLTECICRPAESTDLSTFTAVLRIEKSGRAGKTVTVVDKLPRVQGFVKDLASQLKTACGCGGTFEVGEAGGRVEIQGDKRDAVRAFLQKRGIRCKGG